MSQINVGAAANDHTGDPLRTAFQKINQSKLEYFNVQSYGATGNGSTDDTTAIQNAINAASAVATGQSPGQGVVVYFPQGTYLCRSALTITTYLVLEGACYEGSVLNFNLSVPGTCINWNNTNLRVRFGFGARELSFAGQSPTDSQTLFLLTNCMGIVFSRCMFGAVGAGGGVQTAFGTLTQTSYPMWEHCFFANCATCFNDAVSGGGSNENLIWQHCSFSQNISQAVGAFGVLCSQASADYHFIACSFDSVRLVPAAGTITTIGCHFEDPNNQLSATVLIASNSPGANWTSIGDWFLTRSTTQAVIAWHEGNCTIQGRWLAGGVNAVAAAFVNLAPGGSGSILIDMQDTQTMANIFAMFIGSSTGVCGMTGWTDTLSPDRGDNSVTLQPVKDYATQFFNTPLGSNRTVTPNALFLTYYGLKVRVVRTSSATGASTLTVAGKALAVGQWAEAVVTQAGALQLTAFGSL